ncbi:MAG: hypothetical protein NTV98_03760 [Candidatus Roizmanbacteria bacterium]|nr:hypothetical protein [Candidatus Roizmanbacteria bacterium]
MKIFFTASLRGQEDYGKHYKKIFSLIEDLGYVSLDDEILKLTPSYYDNIQKQGRDAYVDLYERKIKKLQTADICIFECTLPSLSIGYLIQKALDFNKPVVILYLNDNTPQFISGINEDKLIVKKYTEATLTQVVNSAFEEAKHLQDKRFNFFISPDLLTYLEKASKKEGITKSTFIRNLLLAHRRKNHDD